MAGCSGKCCSVFNYSISREALAERDGPGDAFLVDMLISLSAEEAQERALRFEVTPPEGMTIEEWIEWSTTNGNEIYTCRHWDEETRLCGVYDERPPMCKGYPYAKKCQHDCACTETGRKMEDLTLERRAEDSNPSAVNTQTGSNRRRAPRGLTLRKAQPGIEPG